MIQVPSVVLWVAHYLETGRQVKLKVLSMWPSLHAAHDPLFCTLQLSSAEKGVVLLRVLLSALLVGVEELVYVLLMLMMFGGGDPNWHPPVESK